MKRIALALMCMLPATAFASGFYLPWYAEALLWCIGNWPLIVLPAVALLALWLMRKRKRGLI